MILFIRYTTLMAALLCLFAAVNVSAFQTSVDDENVQASALTKTLSKLRSSEDGWLDISKFLDESYGFVPIVIPITEPAVGYGAAGALAFIDKPKGKVEDGFGRPINCDLLTDENNILF